MGRCESSASHRRSDANVYVRCIPRLHSRVPQPDEMRSLIDPRLRQQSAVAARVGSMDRCRARAVQLRGVHLCPITRPDARCCAGVRMDSADSRSRICSPISRLPRPRIRSRRMQPHYPAKAKSVIFLFMDGGVSQMDTFDPKPRLRQDHGKPHSDEDPDHGLQHRRQRPRLTLRVQAVWPVRSPGQRLVPARGHLRR